MKDFINLLNETTEDTIELKKYVMGSSLGLVHKKLVENNLIPEVCEDLVEIVMTMIHHDKLPSEFNVAITDLCSDFLSEDAIDEIPWTLYDTKCIQESAPWCIDEDGYIIEEEYQDLYEAENIDDDDDELNAESRKSLTKRMKNPKPAAKFTVKKKYDKHGGLSKKQIKGGYVKCPPGTQAEGKVRKKGKCNKRTDPALTKKLKRAALSNKAGRKIASRKASKTKKRLSGRRRTE